MSDKTILFSDRPDRIVGSANTTDFIGNWSIGTNNFAVDPPNAVHLLQERKRSLIGHFQIKEVTVLPLLDKLYLYLLLCVRPLQPSSLSSVLLLIVMLRF